MAEKLNSQVYELASRGREGDGVVLDSLLADPSFSSDEQRGLQGIYAISLGENLEQQAEDVLTTPDTQLPRSQRIAEATIVYTRGVLMGVRGRILTEALAVHLPKELSSTS